MDSSAPTTIPTQHFFMLGESTKINSRALMFSTALYSIIIYVFLISTTGVWNHRIVHYPVLSSQALLHWTADGHLIQFYQEHPLWFASILPEPLFPEIIANASRLSSFMPSGYKYTCEMVTGGDLLIPLMKPVTANVTIEGEAKTLQLFEILPLDQAVNVNTNIIITCSFLIACLSFEIFFMLFLSKGYIKISDEAERAMLCFFALGRGLFYVIPLYLVILPVVGIVDQTILAFLCFWTFLSAVLRATCFLSHELLIPLVTLGSRDAKSHLLTVILRFNLWMFFFSIVFETLRIVFIFCKVLNYGVAFDLFTAFFRDVYTESLSPPVAGLALLYLIVRYSMDLLMNFVVRKNHSFHLQKLLGASSSDLPEGAAQLDRWIFSLNNLVESTFIISMFLVFQWYLSEKYLRSC